MNQCSFGLFPFLELSDMTCDMTLLGVVSLIQFMLT